MKFQKIIFTLASIVFLVLFVPQILRAASEETSVAQAETKIYTVIEFESTFMNKRKEDVLETLGEPDKKSQVQGREAWKYSQIVKDVGKVWDQNVMFDFGRVNYVWIDNGK
jgi:archaellum component FlaG (FlaF/FlaG flagellin family)